MLTPQTPKFQQGAFVRRDPGTVAWLEAWDFDMHWWVKLRMRNQRSTRGGYSASVPSTVVVVGYFLSLTDFLGP